MSRSVRSSIERNRRQFRRAPGRRYQPPCGHEIPPFRPDPGLGPQVRRRRSRRGRQRAVFSEPCFRRRSGSAMQCLPRAMVVVCLAESELRARAGGSPVRANHSSSGIGDLAHQPIGLEGVGEPRFRPAFVDAASHGPLAHVPAGLVEQRELSARLIDTAQKPAPLARRRLFHALAGTRLATARPGVVHRFAPWFGRSSLLAPGGRPPSLP